MARGILAFVLQTLMAVGTAGQSVLEFDGEASDHLGQAVDAAGDFDQDGFPDLLLTAPQSGATHSGYAAGLVEIRSGADGSTLFRVTGFDYQAATGSSGAHFGRTAAMAGDLDGDGSSDVLVTFGPSFGPRRIAAFGARSGQAPAFLFEVVDPLPPTSNSATNFGNVLERLGDVVDAAGNPIQDGVPDFAVGSSVARLGNVLSGGYPGNAYVYSGANPANTPALTFPGAAPFDAYGSDIASLGDLNGDGFAEFAVGATGAGSGRGYVDVYDGRTKVVFWQLRSTNASEDFGSELACVGDVTGDGRNDLAVGSARANIHTTEDGRVDVFSMDLLPGCTTLVTSCTLLSGHPPGARLGSSIASFPVDPLSSTGLLDLDHDGTPDPFLDLDHDGSPDYLIGATEYELPGMGNPIARAGAWFEFRGGPTPQFPPLHGEPIHQGPAPGYAPFAGQSPADRELFGRVLALLGNASGDSRALLAIGTGKDSDGAGSVLVWRSTAMSFDVDTFSVSAAGPGTRRRLTLDLGPRWAGFPYRVLATSGGTHPGLSFRGWTLPLNDDGPGGLFRTSVRRANLTPFCNTLGFLDANGRATAEFKLLSPLPASHPWFQSNHHYGFLTLDPTALPLLRIVDASDAVRLRILP